MSYVDERIQDNGPAESFAWAAGFFDGDGGFRVSRVNGRARLVAAITQSPERPNAMPEILARFRGVVDRGTVHGPNPANAAYYWETAAAADVFALLNPWLGQAKILQFRAALDEVIAARRERRRPIGSRSVRYRAKLEQLEHVRVEAAAVGKREQARERSSELAWAAGFFDAEGSTGIRRSQDVKGEVLKIRAKAGQSSEDAMIPDVLSRFRDAVGFGYINGPYRERGRLPHYVWQVAAYADVVRLHELLNTWLGPVKRDQADAAVAAYLAYRSTRRGGSERLPRLTR